MTVGTAISTSQPNINATEARVGTTTAPLTESAATDSRQFAVGRRLPQWRKQQHEPSAGPTDGTAGSAETVRSDRSWKSRPCGNAEAHTEKRKWKPLSPFTTGTNVESQPSLSLQIHRGHVTT